MGNRSRLIEVIQQRSLEDTSKSCKERSQTLIEDRFEAAEREIMDAVGVLISSSTDKDYHDLLEVIHRQLRACGIALLAYSE